MHDSDKRLITFIIVVLIALFLFSFAAEAETAPPRCASLPDVLATLAQRWGEVPFWTGSASATQTVMITANPSGSTWTAILIEAGQACPLATGADWAMPAAALPGVEG